jgi:signal recognition particle subunit SRP19
MKRPGHLIIWPAHLDSSKTRGQGRRLPVSRSVKQPSLKEVWQAAMTLGYSPETTEKAAISYSSWDKTGYVTVKKTAQRTAMLKGIASEIVKVRQKEALAADQHPKKR